MLFHFASVLSSLFLTFAIYLLIKFVIRNKSLQLSALFVATVGGGFGWILSYASDITGPAFTLLKAFEFPHIAVSFGTLILSFLYAFKFFNKGKHKDLLLSSVFAVINFIIHPPFFILIVIVGGLISFLKFLKNKEWHFFKYPILTVFIFSLLYLLIFKDFHHNPGFAGLVGQNSRGMGISSILAGFGILLPFLALSIHPIINNLNKNYFYVLLLFVVEILLFFSPINFTFYFLYGLFVWVAILAFIFVENLKTTKRIKLLIVLSLILITPISRVYTFLNLLKVQTNNPFYYLQKDEKKALDFLKTVPEKSSILTLHYMGNQIPAHTYNRVYFGHHLTTPDGFKKEQSAREFYIIMRPERQKQFLIANNIDYVYYGQEEAGLRLSKELETADPFDYFNVAYSNNKAIIYDVREF